MPDLPWRRRETSGAGRNERLAYVLECAERFGWRFFPVHGVRADGACTCGNPTCARVGKHPATPHGLLDASNNPERLTLWWRETPWANPGLATGRDPYPEATRPPEERPVRAAIVVLDLDLGQGKHGDDTLAQLEEQHGRLPEAPMTLTGGGGRHLYFAHPGGHVGNRAGIRPGIDLRGDGGCIVLPPSIHPSGNTYEWVPGRAPGEHSLASLPPFFLRHA